MQRMRVKIFLLLLLCALQQVHGSKSAKKKNGSRLKKLAKHCLIALALNYCANEVVNAGKPQVADSNFLACKYNVPDKNAGVMMKFVKCAKDQDFEKYVFDNSENCPKIKELYDQTESDDNCPWKNIFDGALARFRGEQLSHVISVEMLKTYLFLANPGEYGEFFESEDSVSDFLRTWKLFPRRNFDFFHFASLLELSTKAYPDYTRKAALMALVLFSEYKDADVEHAKKLFDLTKLILPNDTDAAVMMALQSIHKDVNVERAKKLFEFTKLIFPNDTKKAVSTAMKSAAFTDINVDNANRLLELTKLAYPNDARNAVLMALDRAFKDVNVENAKKLLELTKLVFSNDTDAVEMALQSKYKDVNVEHAKKLFDLTKVLFPYDARVAVTMAMDSKYKDINVDNAKRVLKFTKLAYPDSYPGIKMAVSESLNTKYKNFNVDKVNKKYQELKSSWSWYLSSEQNIMREVLEDTYQEDVKEDF